MCLMISLRHCVSATTGHTTSVVLQGAGILEASVSSGDTAESSGTHEDSKWKPVQEVPAQANCVHEPARGSLDESAGEAEGRPGFCLPADVAAVAAPVAEAPVPADNGDVEGKNKLPFPSACGEVEMSMIPPLPRTEDGEMSIMPLPPPAAAADAASAAFASTAMCFTGTTDEPEADEEEDEARNCSNGDFTADDDDAAAGASWSLSITIASAAAADAPVAAAAEPFFVPRFALPLPVLLLLPPSPAPIITASMVAATSSGVRPSMSRAGDDEATAAAAADGDDEQPAAPLAPAFPRPAPAPALAFFPAFSLALAALAASRCWSRYAFMATLRHSACGDAGRAQVEWDG